MKHLVLFIALVIGANTFIADYATDQKPDMAKMTKLTSPGENHAVLKDLVGNWKATSKFWMDANAKPEESKGTQSNKLIMGGRFLETNHKGTAMGKPVTGVGYLGYDNVRGEYQSVWIDNMTTSIMNSTGTYDTSTKTLTENGTGSCPMTGDKNKTFRGVWTFTDKAHYTYAMVTKGNDGNEYKALEITYAKK